jgi:hypothetical protein
VETKPIPAKSSFLSPKQGVSRLEGLRPCKRCSGLFRPFHGNQALCGGCRHAPVPWRRGEVSLGPRVCALCGAEFEARRWLHKFCSPRCRYAARRVVKRQLYDNPEHRGARLRWKPVVANGLVRCARGAACRHSELVGESEVGGLIHPGEPWHLGHPDGESIGGPEHRDCNSSAPVRLAAREYRQARRASRVW